MISQKFGRFLIKEWLGGGRFADVYLAEDSLIGKEFAIKIARGGEANLPNLIEEVKLLSELLHPNIVRFFTVEKHQGRTGIVLEYINGPSLRRIIKEKAPLNIAVVSSFLKQICSAVDYAHSRMILHRDLKPENILVEGNKLKITDFGLAFFLEGEMTRSVAGTPPYMAPEAWRGKYYKESDIFSMGVVAYELLTGLNPFFADSIEETMRNVKKGIRLRDIPPYIPESEKEAILRATASDFRKRYGSASEFFSDFIKESPGQSIITLKGKGKKKRSNLSEEQKEAVSSPFKYTLVIGGPGTGKSQSLIGRLIYLIDNGVDPEGILITTFTNKGKEDLEERISRYLREDVSHIWLGTFHQISTKILESSSHFIGYSQGFSVIPSGIAQKTIDVILRNKKINYPSSEFLRLISFSKSSLIPPEKMEIGEQKKKALIGIMRAYQEWKRQNGYMDYDDVIHLTYKLLKENSLVREDYNRLFTDIIVDEFQDLNKVQFEIIKLLLGRSGKLFATGDDDQSIYQWRGGKPELVRTFKKVFKENSRIYYLTRSFRLGEEIIAPALNLISRNRDRLEKVMWSEEKGGKVQIEGLATRNEEAEFVLSKIASGAARGRSFNEFAIIARYNYLLRNYYSVLKQNSIPFSVMFNKNFMRKREIEVLINFLKLLSRPTKLPFIFFVNLGDHLISREELKGKRNYIELLKRHPNKVVRERALFLSSLIKRASSLKSSIALKIGVEYTGLLKSVPNRSFFVKSEIIGELMDLAIDFDERSRKKDIKSFLSYIDLLFSKGFIKSEEGVKLISAHSSKGLEFPVVFIVDAYEGAFPAFSTYMTRKRMEEERRLFYVAMTRATEKLYIIFPKTEKRTSVEISRFVREALGI